MDQKNVPNKIKHTYCHTTEHMKIYTLHREQYLPIPIEEAWTFFSSAKNLSKITPPELGFEVLTKLNDEPIYAGMRIKYTVRPLLGIPLKWETLIKEVNAPYHFTDKQLKGPYSLWEHTHRFVSVSGGVRMTDEVKYSLPLGWLGEVVHAAIVRGKLDDIFNFRKETLKQSFG